jgi:hypothetical protein
MRFTKLGRSRALVVCAANISDSLLMAVSTVRRILLRRATYKETHAASARGVI